MAITLPTAADLKARFPEFAPVADGLVGAVIGEAAGSVDETWRGADRSPAILALAAHMLALEGEPGRTNGTSTGAGVGAVQSIKVGDVETQFGSRGAGVVAGAASLGLTDTTYGQRFIALRRRNFPSVTVA